MELCGLRRSTGERGRQAIRDLLAVQSFAGFAAGAQGAGAGTERGAEGKAMRAYFACTADYGLWRRWCFNEGPFGPEILALDVPVLEER
mgnify:FL=1